MINTTEEFEAFAKRHNTPSIRAGTILILKDEDSYHAVFHTGWIQPLPDYVRDIIDLKAIPIRDRPLIYQAVVDFEVDFTSAQFNAPLVHFISRNLGNDFNVVEDNKFLVYNEKANATYIHKDGRLTIDTSPREVIEARSKHMRDERSKIIVDNDEEEEKSHAPQKNRPTSNITEQVERALTEQLKAKKQVTIDSPGWPAAKTAKQDTYHTIDEEDYEDDDDVSYRYEQKRDTRKSRKPSDPEDEEDPIN